MTTRLATLAVLYSKRLMGNVTRGNHFWGTVVKLAACDGFIHEIRWQGLMPATEFACPGSLQLNTAWKTINTVNEDLFSQAITNPLLEDHGMLTPVAGYQMTTIELIRSLVTDEADVDCFVEVFDAVMSDLHRFLGSARESLMRIARNAMPHSRSKIRAIAE